MRILRPQFSLILTLFQLVCHRPLPPPLFYFLSTSGLRQMMSVCHYSRRCFFNRSPASATSAFLHHWWPPLHHCYLRQVLCWVSAKTLQSSFIVSGSCLSLRILGISSSLVALDNISRAGDFLCWHLPCLRSLLPKTETDPITFSPVGKAGGKIGISPVGKAGGK